ncbi:hypothetical protein KKB43_05265 [Patescibacteria group bacterium]|nr:hypothetical protein [Patescibacteria group bacterium]MBU4580395.1 hypothetical protein [Patescibacteria group bacterium]
MDNCHECVLGYTDIKIYGIIKEIEENSREIFLGNFGKNITKKSCCVRAQGEWAYGNIWYFMRRNKNKY